MYIDASNIDRLRVFSLLRNNDFQMHSEEIENIIKDGSIQQENIDLSHNELTPTLYFNDNAILDVQQYESKIELNSLEKP